jgi:hypothetical protein
MVATSSHDHPTRFDGLSGLCLPAEHPMMTQIEVKAFLAMPPFR